MARCPTCNYPLPPDRERVGARCPHCRDPLYEPIRTYGRPARQGEGSCPVHPGVEAVGTCGRCGNFLCEVCRTRWRDQVVCAACVDRALEAQEAAPEQVRSHRRQAILGLVLGLVSWGVGVGSVIGLGRMAEDTAELRIAAALLVLGAFPLAGLAAVLGLGQAATAVRTRGNHMILATIGLLLSGLFLGALLGLLSFRLWQS